jgi:hypothetical protein
LILLYRLFPKLDVAAVPKQYLTDV